MFFPVIPLNVGINENQSQSVSLSGLHCHCLLLLKPVYCTFILESQNIIIPFIYFVTFVVFFLLDQ